MREKYEKDYDDFTLREINEEELSGSLSPFTFLVVSFILTLMGLIMGYSASYDSAVRLGFPHYHFSLEMVFFGALGIITGTLLFFAPIKKVEKLGWGLLPLSLILLSVVTVLKMTGREGFAQGLPELTVSDFCIFSFILAVASVFPRIRDKERRGWIYILTFLIAFLMATLMIMTDGFSYAVLFSLVLCVTFSVSGIEKRYTFVFAFFMLTYMLFLVLASPAHMETIFSRLMPQSHTGRIAEETGACISAVTEGGVFGQGLGAGWYKLGAIRGIENDYIYASIAEETGLVGTLVIMLLFLAFMTLGVRCSRRAEKMGDRFILTCGMGFTFMIIFKVVLHMLVVLGLFPSGAISMPFFSISGYEYFVTMLELSLLYRFMHITGRSHEKIGK